MSKELKHSCITDLIELLLKEYFEHKGKKAVIKRKWRSNIAGTYSPEVDVAIGPFAIRKGERLVKEYDKLVRSSKDLINSLIYSFRENSSRYNWLKRLPDSYRWFLCAQTSNLNARCFMAIEIEGRTSRKHRLGSIINASALGRIGVIVAKNEEALKSLLRIRAYLSFLRNTKRWPNCSVDNVLIITVDQFSHALRQLISSKYTY